MAAKHIGNPLFSALVIKKEDPILEADPGKAKHIGKAHAKF